MFSSFECMMAFRYLRARKQEGFVSVIAGFSFAGIMLGVATLIIVMSVMNGFREELVTRILGLNGHLNVISHSGPLYNYLPLTEKLKNVDGVESVRPMVEGQVLANANGIATGVLVRAFEREDFVTKPIISESIVEGQFTNFRDNQVAIGSSLAKRLNLSIGDSLVLLAPKGKASPFGTVPRSRKYQVGLIFDVGMYEYNNGFIFMPLESAQVFFQIQNGVNILEIITDSVLDLEKIKQDLEREIAGQGRLYDWKAANSTYLNALKVERNVMFLILTLIILVAAFNIISSMIMLVKDKGRDIAILRTMGATRGAMLRIFILTGASIGFAGTFAGSLIGIAFARNIETIRRILENLTGTELFAEEIYFLSQLPAVINWNEVIAVIIMAFALSVAATIYPSLRAARLDPVEALRYE